MNRDALDRAIFDAWMREYVPESSDEEEAEDIAEYLADALLPLVAAAEDEARADALAPILALRDEWAATRPTIDFGEDMAAERLSVALTDARTAAPPTDEGSES